MLWYKNWLETRWRVAFAVGLYSLEMFAMYRGGRQPEKVALTFAMLWIITSVFSAGTGIKTQSAYLATTKGVHGSTDFTLSMPVSRTTLFGIRTTLGLLQMAVVIVAANFSLWVIFPFLHANNSLLMAIESGLSIFACCLSFYFLSALLALFFDPQWQMYAGVAVVGLAWWYTRDIHSNLNFFNALGTGAPLVTHTIPWPAIATSIAIGTILCVATLRIIETREF